VATKEQIEDSIRHEIAHALTPGAGHGPAWKLMCIRVGAKPQRCASYEEVKNMPYKFIGKCPNCGAEFRAHRRLKNMDKRICSKRVCKATKLYVVWSTYQKEVA
jgi:predicted SprT family Zn-dependent metalloprotease